MATQDFNALVPSTVRVIFPRTLDGKVKSSVHTVDVTLASLNLSEYHPVGYTGHSGTKNIRSSCTAVFTTAGGGTPTNNTELNNLANQIAKDFYLWQLGRLDIVFDGIANYEPNAFADSIFWDYRPDKIVTRVQRKGWRDIEEIPISSHGAGGTLTECCGDIYVDGDQVYFGGDSTFTFDGDVTFGGDGTVTFTTDVVFDQDIVITNPPSYSDDTISLTTDDDELTVNIPVYYIDGSAGPFFIGGFPKPGPTGYTDRIVIVNRGSEPIEFPHQNVPTTSANRITTKTYTTGYLPPSGVAELFYDTFSLTWRPGFGLDYQFTYYNLSGNVTNLNVDWGHGLVLVGDGSTNNYLIHGFNNVPWGRLVHIFNSHYGTITIKHNSATCLVATDRVLCPAGETPSAVDDGVDFDLEPLTGAILWYDENTDRVRVQSMLTTYNNLGTGAARVVLQRNGSVLEMRRIDGTDGVAEAENGNYIEIGLDFTSLNAGTPTGTDVFAFYSAGNSRHEKIAYQDLVKFTIVDSGAGTQTVVGDDTITFAGTEGVDLTVSATDTVTASLDVNGLTEIGTVDPAADWLVVYDADAGDHKKVHPDDLGISGGGGDGLEKFNSYLTEYTDWSTASTTNTVTIATYGARTHVDKVMARVKTAFGGGSISALDYTITLESTGESSASDTPIGGLTPAETAHRVSISEYCGSYTNNTVLKVTVTATGGNLDTLTAGALELWVVHRTLPIPT